MTVRETTEDRNEHARILNAARQARFYDRTRNSNNTANSTNITAENLDGNTQDNNIGMDSVEENVNGSNDSEQEEAAVDENDSVRIFQIVHYALILTIYVE